VKAVPDANILMSANQIGVLKEDAVMTLEFDSWPGSETYIRLEDFGISDKGSIMTNLIMSVDSGLRKKVNIRSPYNNSYFGKENYLINLGYSPDGEKTVKITFPDTINFHYGAISATVWIWAVTRSSRRTQAIRAQEHHRRTTGSKEIRMKTKGRWFSHPVQLRE
jgi:hypothetical protein